MLTALERPTVSQVVTEAGDDFEAWIKDRARQYNKPYDSFRASLDELLAAGLLRWDGAVLSIDCGQVRQVVFSSGHNDPSTY